MSEFRKEPAYILGVQACRKGYNRKDFNPYNDGTPEFALWDAGWGHESRGLLNDDLTYKKDTK